VPEADDPFAEMTVQRTANWQVSLEGAMARGIASSDDGIFVADPATHQIWRVSTTGDAVDHWGGYGAAPGAFNTPWGVAVGPDGYLYVADTWNHRVQKLDAQGQPVLSWGRHARVTVNDASTFSAFYGPRAITVGANGDVYVADTGNDRIQVFDREGTFLRWLGGSGSDIGQLDEPVGLAIGEAGELYVADAWNARIQVFDAAGQFVRMWSVPSWQRLGTNDKPFLAYGAGRVWVTDPALGRILAFTPQGVPDVAWVDPEVALNPAGIAAAETTLYVALPQASEIRAYDIQDEDG
jgi:DNA-binding beta-propeller fold protein YncE